LVADSVAGKRSGVTNDEEETKNLLAEYDISHCLKTICVLTTKEERHHLAPKVFDNLCGLVWDGKSIGTRLKDRVSFYKLLESTLFANTENSRSRVATSHGMGEQQLRTQVMSEDVF